MVYTILALNWSNWWKDTQWGTHCERNLIYAPDRDTADLLFRVLMQHGKDLNRSPIYMFNRTSPQVWTWNRYTGNNIPYKDALKETIAEISNGLAPIKEEYKSHLGGRITIDYRAAYNQNDANIPVIPHLDMPDHIAGGTFTIRDKSHPRRFWAKRAVFPGEDCIELSSFRKSRFLITTKETTLNQTVMIFDDKVNLHLIEWSKDGLKYLPISIDSSNGLLRVLEVGAECTPITFERLLKGGFIAATHFHDDHTEYPTWTGNQSFAGDRYELYF